MNTMKINRRLLLISLLVVAVFTVRSQETSNKFDKATTQLLELYQSKPIVALGEIHARQKESDFRLALIRSAEFAKLVDVIIVEFANPLYQETIDNYLNGEQVKKEDLQKVWRNTTQVSGVWDSPVYKEFFKTVHEVNASLHEKDKIRVVAADPPIDWSRVQSFEDFQPFAERGRYPIGVIEKEVFETGLKALLIFGTVHTERWGIGFTRELESTHPGSIAIVLPPAHNATGMELLNTINKVPEEPQLIDLSNSPLGEVLYEDFRSDNRFKGKLKDTGDYLLFLGYEKDKVVEVPTSVKSDTTYQNERRRRFRVLTGKGND